jgi:hypothetical protein
MAEIRRRRRGRRFRRLGIGDQMTPGAPATSAPHEGAQRPRAWSGVLALCLPGPVPEPGIPVLES